MDGRNASFCIVDIECKKLTPRKRKGLIPREFWQYNSEVKEKVKEQLVERGEKDARYKEFDSLVILAIQEV